METALNLLMGPGGTLVFALLTLFAGWKRWWVFGWHYREIAKDRDEWKAAALAGTYIARRLSEHVESKEATDG